MCKRKARQRKPPAWTVSHVICLWHGHSSYSMCSHSKCTAWCPLPEASDVDRRSYVDWGFRCRLRPSRLDIGKTEARHEKSSWRLSISGRHDARRRRESAIVWECANPLRTPLRVTLFNLRLSVNVDHLGQNCLRIACPLCVLYPFHRPAIWQRH
jgi:hypothetical protein